MAKIHNAVTHSLTLAVIVWVVQWGEEAERVQLKGRNRMRNRKGQKWKWNTVLFLRSPKANAISLCLHKALYHV